MDDANAISIAGALGGTAAIARTGVSARQGEFARLMAIADRAPGGGSSDPRQAAEQLVAMVLVEPVLERVRESSEAAPPFRANEAEKQFRALMDARLAQEIVRSANFPLVDRLARDLRARALAG